MSSKFKIEYYHKIPQTTSPYLQLLEAKKKIFGYKYEIIRNDKNTSQIHNKSVSQTQQTQPSHKHSKTQSHQKEKARSQKQNSKKKRSHTEQGEDRLHESLFLNREAEVAQGKDTKHQATKSLFNVEGLHDRSINPHDNSLNPHERSVNPHDFMKNYRNLVSQEEKTLKSMTQQVEGRGKDRGGIGLGLERLEINQIDDLLNLIDTCIEESNDYIAYLTQKIEGMRQEMESMREEQSKILKMKDGIINEKEHEIDRLRKDLHALHHPSTQLEPPKSFEIKKLLEIIDKLSEENSSLKNKLEGWAGRDAGERDRGEKQRKDVYSEIQDKIDILKISIDRKTPQGESEYLKQRRKDKFGKPKFYK